MQDIFSLVKDLLEFYFRICPPLKSGNRCWGSASYYDAMSLLLAKKTLFELLQIIYIFLIYNTNEVRNFISMYVS